MAKWGMTRLCVPFILVVITILWEVTSDGVNKLWNLLILSILWEMWSTWGEYTTAYTRDTIRTRHMIVTETRHFMDIGHLKLKDIIHEEILGVRDQLEMYLSRPVLVIPESNHTEHDVQWRKRKSI